MDLEKPRDLCNHLNFTWLKALILFLQFCLKRVFAMSQNIQVTFVFSNTFMVCLIQYPVQVII
jgi:hypothetical protein